MSPSSHTGQMIAAAECESVSTLALALRLVRFAAPATAIMLLSGMSMLVDTYFVTALGSGALAGVSLVFPFYLFLIMAFGGGLGVALSVVLSVRFGAGDTAAAQRAVGSVLALVLSFSALFMIAFLLGGGPLLRSISGTPEVYRAAMEFARPIFYGVPLIAICLTFSNVLRSEKRVGESAAMLLVSSGVNAALNPVLIHGYLGMPALGVSGAALATIIGFGVSACLGFWLLRGKRARRLRLERATIQVDRRDVAALVRIAVPTLATYLVANCILLTLSALWARFGVDALASYGLATRLEYLLAVVIYSVGAAILTLGGEAWGAGDVRTFLRVCWVGAAVSGLGATVLSLWLLMSPLSWFGLFDASSNVAQQGAQYLRVVALGYPLYAVALTLNYGYQALSRAVLPLTWSVARGFCIAVPVVLLCAGPGRSISVAALGVCLSFIALGVVTVTWLPRTVARVRAAQRPDASI